jgi:hypothetical protein
METTALKMFESTVKYEDSLIWVRPFCDFFQIDVRNQHKKIKNDPVLGKLVEKNRPDFGKIDENGRILLTKKGFLRWIMIINVNIIPEEMKTKFIQYQETISDFFYGSTEQEDTIRKLVGDSQAIDEKLRELARQKRMVKRLLTNALNERYQYSINFESQTAITQ